VTSDITPITAVSKGGTTAETAIEIPEYVTMITPAEQRSIADLAAFAVGLLVEDLPQPVYFSVSQSGQGVSLQFGDTPDSFRALAQWAERFGGTVTGCPHTHEDGRQSVHCDVKFTADGVKVEAYAFITVPKAAPAAT
jgi:hypothetical protein